MKFTRSEFQLDTSNISNLEKDEKKNEKETKNDDIENYILSIIVNRFISNLKNSQSIDVENEIIKRQRVDLHKRFVKRLIRREKIFISKRELNDFDSENIIKSIKRTFKSRSIANVLMKMQSMRFKDINKQLKYE